MTEYKKNNRERGNNSRVLGSVEDQYLKNLPPCKGGPKSELEVGSIVLIEGEGAARLDWPLGLVQSIHSSRDGLTRTVTVKTAKGQIVRPIQRLRNLELVAEEPLSLPSSPTEASQSHSPSHTHDPQNTDSDSQNDSGSEAPDCVEEETEPAYTRCGRKVRPRQLLDL